jgi:hypothetical protein
MTLKMFSYKIKIGTKKTQKLTLISNLLRKLQKSSYEKIIKIKMKEF